MNYRAQYSPGETKIAENRRKHMNPDLEFKKLRSISDEDIVKVLGHRNPGESYKTVHPPLDEMDFSEDMMKDLVEPIQGAKEGVRIRYIQFADSMYNAPAQPYDRARTYMWRFRGVDTGTLSGRQVIEMRELDLERVSKTLLETDTTQCTMNYSLDKIITLETYPQQISKIEILWNRWKFNILYKILKNQNK